MEPNKSERFTGEALLLSQAGMLARALSTKRTNGVAWEPCCLTPSACVGKKKTYFIN